MAVGADDRCGCEKLWAEIAVGFSSSVWSKKTVDFDIDLDFDIERESSAAFIDFDIERESSAAFIDFDFERESNAAFIDFDIERESKAAFIDFEREPSASFVDVGSDFDFDGVFDVESEKVSHPAMGEVVYGLCACVQLRLGATALSFALAEPVAKAFRMLAGLLNSGCGS